MKINLFIDFVVVLAFKTRFMKLFEGNTIQSHIKLSFLFFL